MWKKTNEQMLATWFCHRSTWCFLSWDTDISSTRADSYSASCFSKSATDAFNCTKILTLSKVRAIPGSSVRGKSDIFNCWMVLTNLTNNFQHIYTIKTSFDYLYLECFIADAEVCVFSGQLFRQLQQSWVCCSQFVFLLLQPWCQVCHLTKKQNMKY